jgi:hypothetical protein
MKSTFRKTFFGIASTLFLLGASGCSEETTYSYFTIAMSWDPALEPEFLARVSACGLVVEGSDYDQITVPCVDNGQVIKNLGAADFSTSESSGQLTFTLNVLDLNQKLMAKGVQEPPAPKSYGIVPNGTVGLALVIRKLKTNEPADAMKTVASDAGSP